MPIDITKGKGYRIGPTPRSLGQSSVAGDGFVVLDLRTNKLYLVSGGVWTDAGTFPNSTFTQNYFDTWELS